MKYTEQQIIAGILAVHYKHLPTKSVKSGLYTTREFGYDAVQTLGAVFAFVKDGRYTLRFGAICDFDESGGNSILGNARSRRQQYHEDIWFPISRLTPKIWT